MSKNGRSNIITNDIDYRFFLLYRALAPTWATQGNLSNRVTLKH